MLAQYGFALFNGLATGMAVFLVASGITLIFGILRILNFAHGSFFMIGAYIGMSLLGVRPGSVLLLLAVALAAGAVVGLLGLATNQLVLRRLARFDEATTLIGTFALLLVCEGAVKLIWGLNYHTVAAPDAIGSIWFVGPVMVPQYSVFLCVSAIAVFVAMEVVLHRLWVGKVVRAVAADAWMSQNLGINVPWVYAAVVVVAFALAGFAGTLLLPNQTISPQLSGSYLLPAFIAVIIGGLGNIRGAFIASVLIGLIGSANFILLPDKPGFAVNIAIVVLLLWRPEGLMKSTAPAPEHPPRPVEPKADISPAIPRAALAVAAIGIVSMPVWAEGGLLFLGGLTVISALFALSWNLMFGTTGIASFGHAAYFAVGAYVCGYVLKMHPEVPFLLALVIATTAGFLLALLVGVFALRRATGIAFAILTMGIAEVTHSVIGYIEVLGAEDGLAGIPRPTLGLGLAGISLRQPEAYFWFICVAAGGVALLLRLLTASRIGRVFQAIRQDPLRVSFLGLPVATYRLASFTVAGTVASFAGALQAPWSEIVTPALAGYMKSIEPMLSALLGGMSYFWGPALGTGLFAGVAYVTRTLPGVADLVTGGTLLIVVLAAPNGILGLANSLFQRRARQGRDAPVSAEGYRK